MPNIIASVRKWCHHRRPASSSDSVRRETYRRRLSCEPLEDRQLLSVGVPNFGFALGAGATNNDYGQAAETDAAGNVIVTGSFQDTVDFDPGSETSNLTDAGLGDIFVAKYSPSGSLLWARRLGGTSGDSANGIAVDAEGSVYTTGYFYDTADFDPGDNIFNLTSAGGSDVFVSKLDSAGNFVWAVSMGGEDDECAYDIAVDDGNVYTTGCFNGTADFNPSENIFDLTSTGGDDVFVSKLGSAGNFVWAVSMGGEGYDEGYGIAVKDGNVYTTGSFEDEADFDPGTGITDLASAGYSDIFVSKLDSAGGFVWARNMGGSDDDYGSDIAVDDNENIYITGYFLDTADFDPGVDIVNLTSVGGSDIFVAKLDASGNYSWAHSMGGSSYDEGRSITVTDDGFVYTTGLFYDTAVFDPSNNTSNLTSAGGSDIFVSKLDASGNYVWAGVMGGVGDDEGNGIAVAADGSIYTTGDFSGTADFDPGTGTFYCISAGNSDIFISKLLSNGVPTDITLSANSVAENQLAGTVVGAFSTTDPNTGDTFLYSLVSGTGDTDNGSFMINGNALLTTAAFDYEAKNSYNVCIRSTDQGGLWTEKTFTIAVTDVNLAPTDLSLLNASVEENRPAETVIGTFSTTDTEAPAAPFTYSLVSGLGDTDNGSFAIVDNQIRTTASFDFETKPSYSIRVRSTDQGDLSIEKVFIINVTDVSEQPTDILLSNASVMENQIAGTTVGTLSTTDQEVENTFIYTLASGSGSVDNASFAISGNTLKTAANFDYETKNTYNVRIRSTDQGGLWTEKAFTVNVTNVNETPTDLVLSNGSVAENQPSGTAVGIFSTTDADNGNTFTYCLVAGVGDTDNAAFTISGNTLQNNAAFDYEANDSYSIRVRSTDQGGLYTEKAFVVSVTDVNEQPTDILLTNASVAENQPAGTALGAFSTTDPDSGNTFTYTLVAGTGSMDNASFTISGNTLQTAAAFNYEAKSSYNIRIRSTDQGGLYTEKAFTIGVTNINEQATDISLSNAGIAENEPSGTAVGTFSTTDPDVGNTFIYTLVSGSGSTDNASFTINGSTLNTAAIFDYETKKVFNIRVRSIDQGGLWTEKTFSISVTNVNEQPTDLVLSNSSVWENQPSGAVVGGLSTTDPDADNTFVYSLVAGTVSTDNASFTINGNMLQTTAAFNYEAKSSYNIRIRSTDQGGLYTEKAFTITVTDVNESPTDISLSSASVSENQPSGSAVGTLSTTDPDSGNSFTYSLVAGTNSADNASFTISGSTLKTAASFDYETKNVYNIRVRSIDQGDLWTEKTFTISITDVVEQPQGIIVSTDTVTVSEGGTAQFTVKLNVQPSADVTVYISKQSGDVDLNASPASLTFTSANWTTPQPVTLNAAQDDDTINGTASFLISSTGLPDKTVMATEQDDDVQGLVVSTNSLLVPEGGTAQFTVKLNAQPQSDLTVAIVKQTDGDVDLNASPVNLTFTSANWNTPQAVTISAAQDADTIDGTASFLVSSLGLTSQTIVATEQDNDVQGQGTWQDTVGLLSPTTSVCYLRNTNDVGFANLTFPYGPANAGWKPIAGDWDTNGTGNIGLFSPTTSKFYLRNTNDAGYADLTFQYGPVNSGWLPIAGDWNGDGQDTIGLFNPTTSVFYLRNTNDAGYANLTFQYGPANAGWLPIAGDWDHDGKDTIGLYSPTTSKFYLRNTNDAGYANLTFQYGPQNSGWAPIAGDWNADGTDTIGLFSPTTSVFYLRNTNDAGFANQAFCYGPANAGWLPFVSDWNGSASALRVAGGAVVATPDTAPLTESALKPLVTEAIARWAVAGLSTSSLSMLSNANYVVVDLPSSYLGLAEANTVFIDRDAAGHGWFVDLTPADNLEFNASTSSIVTDRVDLLTTVMHEMGHLLGYDHVDGGLMSAILPLGVRQTIAVDEVFAAFSEPF